MLLNVTAQRLRPWQNLRFNHRSIECFPFLLPSHHINRTGRWCSNSSWPRRELQDTDSIYERVPWGNPRYNWEEENNNKQWEETNASGAHCHSRQNQPAPSQTNIRSHTKPSIASAPMTRHIMFCFRQKTIRYAKDKGEEHSLKRQSSHQNQT